MEGSIAYFLALKDTLYTITLYYYSDGEFLPAFKLKLASTFVLALAEVKLTPLNSLQFSTQTSLKIVAKQIKTAKKCKHCNIE